MVALTRPDDLAASEQPSEFQPLPAGTYDMTFAGADEKVSTNGNRGLVVFFKTDDGMQVSNWINLWHPKANIQARAWDDLFEIARACGVADPEQQAAFDTDSILGRRLRVTVSVRGQYNDVESVSPIPAAVSPPSAAATAPVQASEQAQAPAWRG